MKTGAESQVKVDRGVLATGRRWERGMGIYSLRNLQKNQSRGHFDFRLQTLRTE